MDLITSRYRKPKPRPSKRKKSSIANLQKRAKISDSLDLTVPEEKSDIPLAIQKPDSSYILTHKTVWDQLLKNVPCKSCGNEALAIKQHQSLGYSIKLELLCEACGENYGSVFSSVREESNTSFEVNNKLVSAFLAIGRGHAAMETFSSILNIPSMDKKTFAKCLQDLSYKNLEFKDRMFKISRDMVRKAHMEIDSSIKINDILNISVSFDGTWQKRGHTSNLGIGIVIDILTGLVIDYQILSKYCQNCTMTEHQLGSESPDFGIWYEGHSTQCEKNFDGSSGAMEMETAKIMWERSIEMCQMRYVSILSDGDSKTFALLRDSHIYGKNFVIKKEECINHVAKRLGTSLRNTVKEWRIKNVTLGGKKKGGLTDANIVKLQNYYRSAIKNNAPNLQNMKSAIYASIMHSTSTDAKPKHGKCPVGEASWCFYQRALAKKIPPKSHVSMKTYLSEEVLEKVMPVYQRLASDEILQRCIAGKTQNLNESLHSCIWRKCPKDTFVSKTRLEIAVTEAVEEFNLGHVKALEVNSETVDMDGSFSLTIAKRQDSRRLSQKARCQSDSFKNKRIQRKYKNKKNKKDSSNAYASGAH